MFPFMLLRISGVFWAFLLDQNWQRLLGKNFQTQGIASLLRNRSLTSMLSTSKLPSRTTADMKWKHFCFIDIDPEVKQLLLNNDFQSIKNMVLQVRCGPKQSEVYMSLQRIRLQVYIERMYTSKTAWPMTSKMFTIWPFTEKVCWHVGWKESSRS